MPYKNVQDAEAKNKGLGKYSAKAKRGWLGAFNSCVAGGGPESKCFATAYAAANRVDGKKEGSMDNTMIAGEILAVARELAAKRWSDVVAEVVLGVVGQWDEETLAEMLSERDGKYDMYLEWGQGALVDEYVERLQRNPRATRELVKDALDGMDRRKLSKLWVRDLRGRRLLDDWGAEFVDAWGDMSRREKEGMLFKYGLSVPARALVRDIME